VQEVLTSQGLTRVPLAPPAVAGLMNLRGQVVTAFELRERLGRPPRPEGTDAVVVVVRLYGEAVSLLVDSIADVVDVDAADFAAPPDTLEGPVRDLIRGAYKLDGRLLLALDVQKAVCPDLGAAVPSHTVAGLSRCVAQRAAATGVSAANG
jgi:purine-binding chemotaxis protein CheW